ncbi:hypothetical protein AN2351V1_0382 [Citrobacter koseri]|nr:hypothetical protein AN2351V1_0382 [Citrobacter koseri]CAH5950737.1 hypothetical protein AN2351V1_0382 [Citrobacter koseri]
MKQRQHFQTVAIDSAFRNGDQDRIQYSVFQHSQQRFVGAHRQIQFEIRSAQFHPHDQMRDGFQRQRVERTHAQTPLADPCRFARLFQPARHQLADLLAILQQRPRRRLREQITSFMHEQRTANILFQRMQRAMNADPADIQRLRRPGNIAFLHKRHEDA